MARLPRNPSDVSDLLAALRPARVAEAYGRGLRTLAWLPSRTPDDSLVEAVEESRPIARNWTARGLRTLALCAPAYAFLFPQRTIAAALGEGL